MVELTVEDMKAAMAKLRAELQAKDEKVAKLEAENAKLQTKAHKADILEAENTKLKAEAKKVVGSPNERLVRNARRRQRHLRRKLNYYYTYLQ